MKYSLLTMACLAVLMGAAGCKKDDRGPVKDPSECPDNGNPGSKKHTVIIGVKPRTVNVAIDPIADKQHVYPSIINSDAVSGGPSCISDDQAFYYAVGADGLLDEIEVKSGKIKRSLQVGSALNLSYSASDNSIRYVRWSGNGDTYGLFKLSLSTGNSSKLFDFHSGPVGGRSFFTRPNGNIYFADAQKRLMLLDIAAGTCTVVRGISSSLNLAGYDKVNDKLYYFAEKLYEGFYLYRYDFSTNTDEQLHYYEGLTGLAFSSTAFDAENQVMYVYTLTKRCAIDIGTLEKTETDVSFPMINAEIVTVSEVPEVPSGT